MAMGDTLILGLGNPLRGDDGLGPAVVEWLRRQGLPPGTVVIDGGTGGLDLVLTMMGYRRVLIVDAAELGCAPGTWTCFRPDLARVETMEAAFSMHQAGLAEALALGAALRVLPEEVVIFGVQPAQTGWAPGLSAEVQAVVPVVGQEILRTLASSPQVGGRDRYETGSEYGEDSDHR